MLQSHRRNYSQLLEVHGVEGAWQGKFLPFYLAHQSFLRETCTNP